MGKRSVADCAFADQTKHQTEVNVTKADKHNDPLSIFVGKVTAGQTMSDNWTALLDVLRDFGFDRVLYGKKMYASHQNLHNHNKSILLSTYGVQIDGNFFHPGYT